MPTYAQLVDQAGIQAEAKLAELWARFTAGVLTRAEFDQAGAVILESTSAQTAGLADIYLAHRITQETGVHTSPLGLPPPVVDHMAEAVAITGTAAAAAYALGVAARVAAREAGQFVFSTGLVEHGVPGWRRVPGGSGCPVCAGLSQATFIPSSISMYTHRGCGCHQEIVMDDPGG